MSLIWWWEVWADCLFLLCPQWSSFVKSSLWEAAALKSPQIQLLPLCPGALRQTRTTCGGGEDCVCGLCWARQGVWVFLKPLFEGVTSPLCSFHLCTSLRGNFEHLKTINLKQRRPRNCEQQNVSVIYSISAVTRCSTWASPSQVKPSISNSWRLHVYTSFSLNELMMWDWKRISND